MVPNDASVSSTLAQYIILRAYDANPDPARLQAAYQAGQQAINANPEAADGWASMALVLDDFQVLEKPVDRQSLRAAVEILLAQTRTDKGALAA